MFYDHPTSQTPPFGPGLPKRKLGRGLEALFEDEAQVRPGHTPPPSAQGELIYVAVSRLGPSPFQPRLTFDAQELEELSASIRKRGVLQPLLVRSLGDDVQLVAGERRLRASKLAGLTHVPCRVLEMSDAEALEVAVLENIQRADLSPLEEAKGYRQLIERCHYTQDALAQRLGKSRAHIANMMRLLTLPQEIQDALDAKTITPGHARALVGVADAGTWLQTIQEKNLSVREVERLLQQRRRPKTVSETRVSQAASSLASPSTEEQTLARELSEITGLPITLQGAETGGTLTVQFRSPAELDHFLTRLTRAYLPSAASPPLHLDLSLETYDDDV